MIDLFEKWNEQKAQVTEALQEAVWRADGMTPEEKLNMAGVVDKMRPETASPIVQMFVALGNVLGIGNPNRR